MVSFPVALVCAFLQAGPSPTIEQRCHQQKKIGSVSSSNAGPFLLATSLEQQAETESKDIPCRKFFEAFNDHVNERVDRANQVQRTSSQLGDAPIMRATSILSIHDAGKNLVDEIARDRTEFVREFCANGGFAVVRFSDKDAKVMSNMWGLAKAVFETVDRTGRQETEPLGLRHQDLIRGSDKENADNEVGYSYVEINNRDESLCALEKIVGDISASNVASASMRHLTTMGTQLAAVVAAELISTPLAEAHALMKYVIGTCHEEKSISFQRLARYMKADSKKKQTENLGGHCDWSVFTIVPVSEVAGLQVFDMRSQTWICPEAVARKHAEQASPRGANLPDGWNGAYAVVMTGKWFELLTNGKVESTIHRVISLRNTPQRYSAPFFLRLNLETLDALESLDLEKPMDVCYSRSAISSFLQHLSAWAQ